MTLAILLGGLATLACATTTNAAGEVPPVTDGNSGITVRVKADGRTLAATGKDGQSLWEADVIRAAGPPAVGQPMVRHLSLKGGTVRAIYGKHSYADFDLATGKLVGSGSD